MKRIGIGWTLGSPDAGGVYALNLALELTRQGRTPAWLGSGERGRLDVLRERLLAPSFDAAAQGAGTLPYPVLQALGGRWAGARDTLGSPTIGMLPFAHAGLPADTLRRAAALPLVITGSAWNARMLREQGLNNVLCCPAGVDPAMFHPAPRAGLLPGRFAVFAGGKFEPAKGPDIVIAAFRLFWQRHPEAVLVCTWGVPDGAAWLAGEGIAPAALLDLGRVCHSQMPAILRECDLAVFPGRCAGGSNLGAMEALACGVPTVLAGHTGYLDLIGEHAYVLKELGAVTHPSGERGYAGWGECAVEELLACMERAYARRAEAAAKGQAGAAFMQERTWERHVARLLAAVDGAAAGASVAPPDAEQQYRWGLGLHRAGRLAEAEQAYDAALELAPAHVLARGDRGNVRRLRGNLAGAEADFRALLAARPGHPRALQSLGNVLRQAGQLDLAADCLQRAVAGAGTASAHWDLAFLLLLMGRYAQAWPHFEHRHAALGLRAPDPAKPRWNGQPVLNATLLVLDEQGLGDTLQFLRFLSRIPVGAGGRVIFAGKPEVLPVVRRILPAADVFRWDQALPHSQCWVPLMSLPGRLGVARPEDLPDPDAQAYAEPERAARWQALVRGRGELPVVALCWRGNPDFPDDAARSPGLGALRPLLEVGGLRFVALQVGPGRREIAELGLAERLDDVGAAIEAAGADILDTLAVLANCDFVISSCTSVAHMAGLAGCPGRVLLCSRPDWRWMMERADTPWYRTLGLIRQRTPGDWSSVAAEAAAQLAAWRDGRALAPAGGSPR